MDFDFGSGVPVADEDATYGEKALAQGKPAHSFFADVLASNKGDQAARERLTKGLNGKAMTEGTNSAGGYLVQPEIMSELITLREQSAVLRALCSKVNVTSSSIQIASVTGGATAGWVAELATKPTADLTFGQVTASVFTAAGLGVVSNQLLADASPSVDGLVTADIAKRLATLEEVAFLDGSGSGQPTGLLNTSGVNSTTLTSTTIPDLLDAIVDGITNVQTNYQGAPSHINMHPRTWARIMKARESSAPSTYLIGAGSTAFGRRANDPLPVGELFGLPVIVTKNMPTTKGSGTNESRVIVGNFQEALILDRQGVTVDQSQHVYFTSNQTVFRVEERVGFTAARYPKAFSVIGGAGLAAG
jgi:HK97 family phage major capsid protein